MPFKCVLVKEYKLTIFFVLAFISVFQINAYAVLSPGFIGTSQTICTGSTPNAFTSIAPASGGIGTYNYKWQQSTTGLFTGYSDIVGANSITYTPGSLTQTTYFRRAVSTLDDPIVFSDPITITVNPASVGGTLAGGGHYCPTVAFPVLLLSGHVGSVVRWERSTVADFSSNVTTINFTNTNLTTTVITPSTTYYRAVVKSGICPEVFSDIDTVVIDSATVGGTIAGGAGVCAGTNSTLLTLSGYTGAIIKWQSSTSPTFSNSITDIVNTSNTYTASNISVPTYFRAVLKSGTCSSENSSIASILILSPTVGGSLSGPLGFCGLVNSSTLTLTTHVGTIIEWQSSTFSNFSSSVTSIPNTANLTSYTVVNLSTTTYYRVLLQNGPCATAFSSIKALSALTPFPVAGTIAGPTSLCIGPNNGTLTLTGFSGSVLKWQSCSLIDFSSGVIDISNTTSTLTINNVGTPTYYRAIVFNGPIACEDTTSPKLITLDTEPIAGVLLGNDSVCSEVVSNNTLFTLTSYTGTILKWQSSTSASFATNVIDIANSLNTYTATNVTTTTYYRVIVSNGACDPDTSTVGFVYVFPASVGGAVFGNNPFNPNVIVCSGINSSMLVVTGYTGTIIKWQSSTSPTFANNIIDIANIGSSHIVTNLTTTTYYRVIVQSGDCDTAISAIRVITVNPNTVGGILNNDTVCIGINSSTLRLLNYVGTIVKWESSTVSDFSSGVVSIANTSDSLVVSNVSTPIYYRVIVKSGICSSDTSTVATIVVNTLAIGGTLSGGGHFCPSLVFPVLSLTGQVGSIVRWERSTIADFSSNVILIPFTGSNYTTTILTPSTTYYRVVIKNGVCPVVYSSVDTIIIDSATVSGTLTGSDTVCAGVNNSMLTLTNFAGTILKWQTSSSPTFTNNVIDFNTIIPFFNLINITSTTYIRVIVQNGFCTADTSNVVFIQTINPNYSNLIFTPQPDSFLNSGNPAVIIGTAANIDSTYFSYQWQFSIVSDTTDFVDISGATARDFDPNTITQTTWFRRILVNPYCAINDTSNIVVIRIITEPVNSNPVIGAAKSVLKPKVISFGVYQIQYTITIKNYGNTDLHQLRVLENLSTAFPSPAEFNVTSISVGNGLTANVNFDGVNNVELLDPSQSILNIGESSTITIKIQLTPNLPNVNYKNQVLVYGTVKNGSTVVVDTSINGDNPDPNEDGLPDEDSPTPVDISVFVPTGYSPNGDGKNDEFIIIGLENYPNNKLEIYNRWGNKVFEQAPYDNTWKGTVKNSVGYVIGEGLLPSGTYFYLLDFGVPGVEQLSGYIVIRK